MNINTHIDNIKSIRRHTVQGVMDVFELKEKLNDIYSSPDYSPDMNVIWDLRGTDFSTVKTSEVRCFVEFVSKRWGVGGSSKAALVVSKDVDYGISRMYEMLMDGSTSSVIKVFKDISEASKWIEEETEQ